MYTEEAHKEQLEMYLIWLKDRGYTADTQNGYLHDVRSFLRRYSHKPVKALRKIDVMSHLTQVRTAGSGDRARNRALSAIRLFFKVMIEFEVVDANSAIDVPKSKVEKKKVSIYIEEDYLGDLLQLVPSRYQVRDVAILTPSKSKNRSGVNSEAA